VRFVFIAAEKAHYPVRILCRCLQVSRSGFYAWMQRRPSRRSVEDGRLIHRLRRVHASHRRVYGRPRLRQALSDDGIRISEKRVRRLMRVQRACVADRG
jgi:putative transposase